MTVIAAMIAKSGTVHATDSLLTTARRDGRREVVESRRTKIVHVRAYRGAIAYWGFAGRFRGSSTLAWLTQEASAAHECASAEVFAERLAKRLQDWLESLGVEANPQFGVGLHFTGYERVNGRSIPELFLISNFANPSYSSLRPTGVGSSRETHSTAFGVPRSAADREAKSREKVHDYLQSGGWLRFNNGDPLLFNPTADAVAVILERAKDRGVLAPLDLPRLSVLTRMPVETVARTQQLFFADGRRIVGGKIHVLGISPAGQYFSTTGDAR